MLGLRENHMTKVCRILAFTPHFALSPCPPLLCYLPSLLTATHRIPSSVLAASLLAWWKAYWLFAQKEHKS